MIKALTDFQFSQKDENGHTLFFPYGARSKALVFTEEKAEITAKRLIFMFYSVSLLFSIPLAIWGSTFELIGCLAGYGLLYITGVRYLSHQPGVKRVRHPYKHSTKDFIAAIPLFYWCLALGLNLMLLLMGITAVIGNLQAGLGLNKTLILFLLCWAGLGVYLLYGVLTKIRS